MYLSTRGSFEASVTVVALRKNGKQEFQRKKSNKNERKGKVPASEGLQKLQRGTSEFVSGVCFLVHIALQSDQQSQELLLVTDQHAVAGKSQLFHHLVLNQDRGDVFATSSDDQLCLKRGR